MITKWYVCACEFESGRTMMEYAIILSALAIVTFAGYHGVLNTIDGKL